MVRDVVFATFFGREISAAAGSCNKCLGYVELFNKTSDNWASEVGLSGHKCCDSQSRSVA